MGQPEARLQRSIQKKLREEYGEDIYLFKVHGGPMMPAGLPDLICCVYGIYIGVEVKMPQAIENVSVVQRHVHARIVRAGGAVVVASSVAEALAGVARVVADTLDP
jgi:hypothetical protein